MLMTRLLTAMSGFGSDRLGKANEWLLPAHSPSILSVMALNHDLQTWEKASDCHVKHGKAHPRTNTVRFVMEHEGLREEDAKARIRMEILRRENEYSNMKGFYAPYLPPNSSGCVTTGFESCCMLDIRSSTRTVCTAPTLQAMLGKRTGRYKQE